jgi:serine/threonine protein kinase
MLYAKTSKILHDRTIGMSLDGVTTFLQENRQHILQKVREFPEESFEFEGYTFKFIGKGNEGNVYGIVEAGFCIKCPNNNIQKQESNSDPTVQNAKKWEEDQREKLGLPAVPGVRYPDGIVVEHEVCGFLVSTLAEMDLFDLLTSGRELTKAQKLKMIQQLAEQLVFLHNENIALRDIKLENVVCMPGDKTIKLWFIDFGFATYLPETQLSCGSDKNAPPEYAARCEKDCCYDPKKGDLFSFASVMISIWFGVMCPYTLRERHDNPKKAKWYTHTEGWDDFVLDHKSLADWLNKALSNNPADRPTLKNLNDDDDNGLLKIISGEQLQMEKKQQADFILAHGCNANPDFVHDMFMWGGPPSLSLDELSMQLSEMPDTLETESARLARRLEATGAKVCYLGSKTDNNDQVKSVNLRYHHGSLKLLITVHRKQNDQESHNLFSMGNNRYYLEGITSEEPSFNRISLDIVPDPE